MGSTSKVEGILRDANLRLCRLRLWSNYEGFGFNLETLSKPPYVIRFVEPYSPAAAGGLRISDIVLAIDNQAVSSSISDVIIQARDTNSRVELLVISKRSYRSLKKKKINIDATYADIINTPRAMPVDYQSALKYLPWVCEIYLDKSEEKFGFDIADEDDELGALISIIHPNTPASRTALRPHDRIIEINKKPIGKKRQNYIYKKLDHSISRRYVRLYVMDSATYEYYQSNQRSMSSKEHRKDQLAIIKNMKRENHRSDTYASPNTNDKRTTYDSKHHSDDRNKTIHIRKRCYAASAYDEHFKPSISIRYGDLKTQGTDVIVVCSSSQYLFDSICKAGGNVLCDAYNAAIRENSTQSVIAIRACGELIAKEIYFLPWQADSDAQVLQNSIKKFVSNAIQRAAQNKYKTIAFPAIGYGKFGCTTSLIAQTLIEEVDRLMLIHSISVVFVIEPNRTDIYDQFQQHILALQSSGEVEVILVPVGRGTMTVEHGDITMQKVDVIICDSSSEILRKAIIRAAGNEVKTTYYDEYKKNPGSVLIVTSSGELNCRKIFFYKWKSTTDQEELRQSFTDLMSTVIQNMIASHATSIAFPPIGCGKDGCPLNIAVKTMVREVKSQLVKRNVSLTMKFVIPFDQTDVYDEFCKQVSAAPDDSMEPQSIEFPSIWEKSKGGNVLFPLSSTSDEYQPIAHNFDQAMQGNYRQIIRIERIQNVTCYVQYSAYSKDFKRRLNVDTEKRLYHGCPEQAAHSIIAGYFNRTFAGVNGTVYGVGAYFSSNAAYSHKYADPSENGERCMFVVRVLVGKTTLGDDSMKTPPAGFDSTTDGNHIFVTYHDAQALPEYLITYK